MNGCCVAYVNCVYVAVALFILKRELHEESNGFACQMQHSNDAGSKDTAAQLIDCI